VYDHVETVPGVEILTSLYASNSVCIAFNEAAVSCAKFDSVNLSVHKYYKRRLIPFTLLSDVDQVVVEVGPRTRTQFAAFH
jgi:hypothetical protein